MGDGIPDPGLLLSLLGGAGVGVAVAVLWPLREQAHPVDARPGLATAHDPGVRRPPGDAVGVVLGGLLLAGFLAALLGARRDRR